MAILGGKKNDDLAARLSKVEEALGKIDQHLDSIASRVEMLTPEGIGEVLASADRVVDVERVLNAKRDEATSLLGELENVRSTANSLRDKVAEQASEATQKNSEVESTLGSIKAAEVEYQETLSSVKQKLGILDAAFAKYPNLEEEIELLESAAASAQENEKKTDLSLSNINKRREEVEDLHRQVFGYTHRDETTGEEKQVPGLKEELEKAYEKLDGRIGAIRKEVGEVSGKYQDAFKAFEKEHKVKYRSINDEISSLLPGALTAGLSAAFAEKKKEEVKNSEVLQKRFQTGIWLMAGASLIPILAGGFFLFRGLGWEQVLLRVPRMVFTMLPLYIPILWFTYSASKKLNLSKRLIEEYAHKEVLSRTYEGLAKQIQALGDAGQSAELRFRLLANFLMATSENPGKLISNYQASDHPVMEALEQSYKLQVAVDKLEGIPGLDKLAAKFEKRRVAKISEREEKIKDGLDDIENDGSDEKK